MPDWDGEQYAQTSDLQRAMATRAVAGLDLEPDDRLLDVGCGDGFVTRLLAERLPEGRAVGVDASPRMIAKADTASSNVQFVLADARDLPFRAEFDVVVSFNALHWVVEQQRALGSIAAAARPDARVLIQVVCAGDRPSPRPSRWRWPVRPAGWTGSPDSLPRSSTSTPTAIPTSRRRQAYA